VDTPQPTLGYAKAGTVNIAYAVVGSAERDVLVVPGFLSHLMLNATPPAAHVGERLASFARVIVYDRPGTGLSDPLTTVPTLDERIDYVRAVMDAVGSERACVLAFSEGAATAMLFAATYPERVSALALYGAMARTSWAPDYTFANHAGAMLEASQEFLLGHWGEGTSAEVFAPSKGSDPEMREWYANVERMGASPATAEQLMRMYVDVDVRGVVPSIHVPTLVLHRTGDQLVNIRHGRWLADHLPNARYVELTGIDHSVLSDSDQILDEVEEFFTGSRPVLVSERVVATVMFTDLVGSTERAVELGDAQWRHLLERQQGVVRLQLQRFRGQEVKSTGDGFLATFDGPARAVHCGQAIVDAVRDLGLDTRVGLHAGEVEVMGEDIGGIAVHIAARVGALAGGNEVLVSETVKGLVAGSGIAFEDRGEHDLKGMPDRWRLFRAKP